MSQTRESPVLALIADLALMPAADLPERAREMARLSLMDWMACGLAGADEPVAGALRMMIAQEGGVKAASVIGGGRAPARGAALVNGAASHALDYDDTHFGHIGHLSVAIYPAALALGEETDQSAGAVVTAFLAGAEAAIRVGLVLGAGHYNLGFHQTATAGAFGATVAAARLLGLSRAQIIAAIGLCATRASGLKSQFGTMGKPYNAGIAAANGIECARLAALGMSSADDGLMGHQGFVATHAPTADETAGLTPAPAARFLFEDNKYKLHACCHGTHAMIEALLAAPGLRGAGPERVAALALRTSPRWLRVCDLKQPRSGLEVKFSYGWLAGMVLRGDATGDDRIYTDGLALDAGLAGFAQRVTVIGDDSIGDMQAALEITLDDGSRIVAAHDLDQPVLPAELAARLRAKAVAMLGAAGAALWDDLADLTTVSARDLGARLRARG
ncbi:MAG: MmgE/PrpD family protein [Paracoccus sp. (in: a-proteobacteria)]|nr:MmgE/PrpD family protein [Paracoccus sp. (in: a-proteobacteria)]